MSIKKIASAFACWLALVFLLGCQQKNIKDHVISNRSDISTIQPDSTDFHDLMAIGDAIGQSRVVMLGEQDHGDAPTFLAKTRLVKYLHEKKRFNVLAFESDFFALNEGWDRLTKAKANINSFLPGNIFPIWTECRECENLFYQYIPKTYADDKPLVVSGFDSQSHGDYTLTHLRSFLDNYLKKQNINYVHTEKYKTDLLSFVDTVMYKKGILENKRFKEALQQIINELKIVDTTGFEMQLLKSLMSNAEHKILDLSGAKENSLNNRDRQMAENLRWLVNHKFPNQKIIVWAHNTHIMKNTQLLETSGRGWDWVKTAGWKRLSMGTVFTLDKNIEAQTYVLGFDSRAGTAGRVNSKKYAVTPPVDYSFESWIPETEPYAFVDFKKFRKDSQERKTFLMKGLAHFATNSVWTNHFDGVFYIRDMYPCTKRIMKTKTK